MFDFKSLRQTFQSVGSQLKSLENELKKKRLQRDELVAAPMCFQDAEEYFHHWVDIAGARYPEILFKTQNGLLTHAMTAPAEADKIMDYDFMMRFVFPYIAAGSEIAHIHPGNPNNALAGVQSALCFFFPELIKQKLSEALTSWNWETAGLPRVERLKEIGKLDKKISEIEAEQADLRREINSLRNDMQP